MAVKKEEDTSKYGVGDTFIYKKVNFTVVAETSTNLICKSSGGYLAKFDKAGDSGTWLEDNKVNSKYSEYGELLPKLEVGDTIPSVGYWDDGKKTLKSVKVLSMEGDEAICKAGDKFYNVRTNTYVNGNEVYTVSLNLTYDSDRHSADTKKALADAGFKGKVDKPAKKRKIPAELQGKLFVVNAHSGRNNGCALVAADSKGDAKKIAKNSGWLDLGQVDNAMTFKAWCDEMGDDQEEIFAQYPKVKKIGDWDEIEWGS